MLNVTLTPYYFISFVKREKKSTTNVNDNQTMIDIQSTSGNYQTQQRVRPISHYVDQGEQFIPKISCQANIASAVKQTNATLRHPATQDGATMSE